MNIHWAKVYIFLCIRSILVFINQRINTEEIDEIAKYSGRNTLLILLWKVEACKVHCRMAIYQR